MEKTAAGSATIKEALDRWPRLTAHLICESLGQGPTFASWF